MAPKDRGARERMKECDKLVKKIAFEKAIEAEETKLLSELINIDDICKCMSCPSIVMIALKLSLILKLSLSISCSLLL
tara:strand:+ start:634 stop:867 length:234 start_codon:yes stop_codon:yes gene_type:complete